MKKLMRKLVLSCFALGLAVVTLTTTTFAWYTTNTEATITDVQGTTQGEVAGSLEIAKYSAATTWGPTVSLKKEVKNDLGEVTTPTDYINEGGSMIPLQSIEGALYNINPALKTAADDKAAYQGDRGANGQYIQFTVYVRNSTGEATEVYLKNLTIKNTVANDRLPVKNQLVANNIGGMTGQLGDSYTVDAVRALSMSFTSTAAGAQPFGTNSIRYSLGESQTVLDGSNVGTANAIEYYNYVMNPNRVEGEDIKKPDTYTETAMYTSQNGGTTAIKVADIAAWVDGTPSSTTLTFTIWLEGWDAYCYDACQGQTFDISFALTTKSTDALIGTKPSA